MKIKKSINLIKKIKKIYDRQFEELLGEYLEDNYKKIKCGITGELIFDDDSIEEASEEIFDRINSPVCDEFHDLLNLVNEEIEYKYNNRELEEILNYINNEGRNLE